MSFGLLNKTTLLFVYKKDNELRYDSYDFEAGKSGSNGMITENIDSYEYGRLFMKNVRCLTQENHPFSLALVMEVQ